MLIISLINLLLFIKAIFCLTTGNTEVHANISIKNITYLDSNITRIYEQLRSLDKELTKMYKNPPDGKGEDMLKLSQAYNQASAELLTLCSKSKRRVFKTAKDILDHGGPYFLDVDFDEETLKDAFKWEQETMDKLSMLRLKIGEHWFDLWSLYKKRPDYDYPEYNE